MNNARWWSLAELNAQVPDHHHDSTVENLAGYGGASEDLRCFLKEDVPVAEINEFQLHDDPEDLDGIAKIESIRSTIRSRVPLPAVVLIHTLDGRGLLIPAPGTRESRYFLLEGRHRYNAAYRERSPRMFAWVAHIGCCAGPEHDLEGEAS